MDRFKAFTHKWSSRDDGSSSSDPTVRRREQIRRAQQTYRQRKEGYIKSLENEVLHLRTARSNLTTETKKLTAEIQWLRQVMHQNGILIPSTPVFDVSQASPTGSRDENVHSPPKWEPELGPTATVGIDQDLHNNKRIFVLDDALTGNGNGSLIGSPGSVQRGWQDGQCDVVTGMNFILSLEAPCLEHVRSALYPGAGASTANTKSTSTSTNSSSSACTNAIEGGHGHALTLTASVYRLYENSDSSSRSSPPRIGNDNNNDNDTNENENDLLNVSKKTLNRLLELSAHLTTADELTATQAWAYLCQSPAFVGADKAAIMDLAQGLVKNVRCYGYGAVVPRDVVVRAVSQFSSARGGEYKV
ncbi:hypothetical protein BDW74DRAFT_158370 [Aspergillus multicolor]|uniref:bZIP transcription factor n=1 Tax=Aspergillus multicolor TaxID=41759 RepID=UPI003CCDEE74